MAVESSLVWVIYIALGSVFAFFLNMDRLTHAWPDRIETAGALLLVVFCFSLCGSPALSGRPFADAGSPQPWQVCGAQWTPSSTPTPTEM